MSEWQKSRRVSFKADNKMLLSRQSASENGWMNGWMDGWMDEWMDGWIDGVMIDGKSR